jgi:septum site-determining protein MinD
MGKIIGVMSLKGGVGKTSVVAALGTAISEFGKKVLLIDGNFSAPNLGIHFNLVDPEFTLHDVMTRKANAKKAIYAVGELDILPAAIFTDDSISPLRLKEKIKFLKKKYDVILIDSSPNLGDEGLATLFASDEVFFVITPDHSSLSNTLKTINRVNERGTTINGLILNQVHDKDFELTLDQIEDTTNIPVMAVIPFDLNVKRAQSNFVSSVKHKPKSRSSKEYKKLAAALTGEKYKAFDWRGLFKLGPRKEEINRELFYERLFD